MFAADAHDASGGIHGVMQPYVLRQIPRLAQIGGQAVKVASVKVV